MSWKKYFKRVKEAQLNHRLLKPFVETFLAFELDQPIEKPVKFNLWDASTINLTLKNSKEK